MNIPQPPTESDVSSIKAVWGTVSFFLGLIVSGGIIEYSLSRRFVSKAEWDLHKTTCKADLSKDIKIALLENNAEIRALLKADIDDFKDELIALLKKD